MLGNESYLRPLRLVTMFVAVLNFICIAGVLAGGGTNPNPWQDPDSYSDDGDDNSTARFYTEGELVVKMTGDSISIGEINSLFGTEVKQFLPQLEIFLLSVAEGVDLEFLAATIDSLPSVIYAHPNYLVDPLQPVQGSFPISDENLNGEYEFQWAAGALALADAHGFSRGGGVKVAVIDGGVDYTHQAFNGMAISGYDYVDEDHDAFDEPGGDNSGHGTYVAGIIHRVAPEAEIRAYRVSEISGDSHGYLVAEAILQAVEDGCHVINLSLVMMNEHSAIAAAIDYARNRDVIVAVAAGNFQEYGPLYPASDSSVIAVAATDSLSHLADFSRYGTHIDVCAPGANVFSPYQDGLYAWWSGTSFAAPFVAGQAALLISYMMPDYSWEAVKHAILNTASNLDELNPAFAGLLGEGLIDPVAALTDTVQDEFATLVLGPDSMFFEVDSGTTALQYGNVFLLSTNAPAAYSVTVLDTSQFTTIINDQGFTNDSVVYSVNPAGFGPGLYYDTLRFMVEGTWNTPIDAIMTLSVVTPGPGEPRAFVHRDSVDYIFDEGYAGVDTGWVYIVSENAPAPYTVSLIGTPVFLELLTDSGVTDETVYFTINLDGSLPVGSYCDTMLFEVEGVINNPVLAPVWISIVPDVQIDSAWVQPRTLDLYIEEGEATVDTFCFDIYSTNAPALYTVYPLNELSFITLLGSPTGYTNDRICFVSDPRGLEPGIYSDTLYFEVDGIIQWIGYYVATVAIRPAGAPPDSAFLTPDTLFFTAQEGTYSYLTGYSWLSSTNAPANFTATKDSSASHYLGLITFSGQTNDSVGVSVVPSLAGGAGVYHTFVVYDVDGVVDPVFLYIVLTIESSSPPTDTAFLSPDTLFFTAYEGEDVELVGYSYLSSTNAPANYSAYTDTDCVIVTLIDTAGQTNDSVGVRVNTSMLGPGVYNCFAMYFVDGVEETAFLYIILTIESSSPPLDTAFVSPDTLFFTTYEGENVEMVGYSWLSSTNAPAPYHVKIDTNCVVATLIDTAGETNDSVGVRVNTGVLGAGVYYCFAIYFVDSVENTPVLQIVVTIDSLPPPDSAPPLHLDNIPNPFNVRTNIRFTLAAASEVNLSIYNLLGQKVITLVNRELPPGDHIITWDGNSSSGEPAASGIYLYRIEVGDIVKTRKMLLLK